MRYRFSTRRFLNRRGHHAGGYVLAHVEDTSRRRTTDRHEALTAGAPIRPLDPLPPRR